MQSLMSPEEEAYTTHAALRELPLRDQMSALMLAITRDNPNAADAVIATIAIATVMAKRLPSAQRTAVCWHLAAAAAELDAKWN